MTSKTQTIPGSAISPGVRFAMAFCGWLLLLSAMFWGFDLHLHLLGLQRLLAISGAWLDNLIGGSARVEGTDIILGSALSGSPVLNINHECTGVFLAMLLVSFVLAYPAAARARVMGLVVGLPLLLLAKVIRLGVLGRLIEVYPAAFFYFHEYVWQGIFMVLILLGCFAWAERIERA